VFPWPAGCQCQATDSRWISKFVRDGMTVPLHPAAPHHLLPFMIAPGETDVLMLIMAVFLVFAMPGIAGEFPRDRQINVICRSGQRAYLRRGSFSRTGSRLRTYREGCCRWRTITCSR
jgi:hypothetical protein